MHRQLLNFPENGVVDHTNMNGLDNRRSNLRIVTKSQNGANSPAKSRSGFKGIERYGNWWRASIRVDGIRMRSAIIFKTQVEAARHYDDMAKHYFGEYARLNFRESYAVNWIPG